RCAVIGERASLRRVDVPSFEAMSVLMSEAAREIRAASRASARAWTRAPAVRYVAEGALLAVLYWGSAKLGFDLGFSGPVAAIVWLPVGVGIASLCIRGLSFWPGMLVGDLIANNYMTIPVASALGQTLGNVLEVLLAAYLLRRLNRRG